MNSVHSQSYLDLSVLPDLRPTVLSNTPVVVFTENLDSILWSNATGAQLFGGTGVIDLLAITLPQDNPVLRQLRHAIEQMADAQQIVRGIRFGRTFRSQMLQFELKRIDFPLGVSAIKTTLLTELDDKILTEHELAKFAVASLDGFADAAAIVDDSGLAVDYSPRFSDLGPDEDILANMVDELKNEEDRLIKRPVHSVSGELTAIGLARLSDQPGRNLIVIAKVEEDEPEQPVELDEQKEKVPYEDKTAPLTPLLAPEEQDPVIETDIEDVTDTSTELQESLKLIADELNAEILEPEEIAFEANNASEIEEPKTVETFPEDTDELVEMLDQTEDHSDETQTVIPDESLQSHTPPDHNDVPEEFVRFAWSVDAETIFTSVSDELASVVGENPANIIGRKWQDVAQVMGFDQDQQIESLLRQRDTWSGKIVHWPVEGTDKIVPIDLAALPIFNTDREFEGFRGYGKIHSGMMLEDPDAIGLAFSGETADETSADYDDAFEFEDNEPRITIGIESLEPDTDEWSTDEEETQSNIVPFSGNTVTHPTKTLSESELEAFEAVREHLKVENLENEIVSEPQQHEEKRVDTSLLEKLPVAVLVYRSDETLFANQQLLDFSGYETIADLADAGGISALLDTDDEDGQQCLIRQDGSQAEVNVVMHSVPWDEEKALLLSFAQPANTEPDALELTKVSEVQNILDTTTDGIILLDESGKIISINAPAEALFGTDFDDAVDRELEYLFAAESQPTIKNYLERVMMPGVESLINDGEEAIARESGGGMLPVFITIARMEQTGKLCAVIRDITNWKKAEEELIQSKQHAERANELKSQFLAQVSHEIRTPLNAIIGFSDVMIEERFGAIDNERYREYLRDIKRSGVHVLDIINELLDLSKVEAGKLDLSFEAVDLNEMVAKTVALLQPQANTNRTIIRTSLSRSVPKVVADPRSVRQIILNLVSNAIKYSKANSQVIVSTVYETNGEVALRVRDTGRGMTDAQIEMAMKPFKQVHTISENNPEGTGLGLPLTKALVEANRAYFELESNPGSGTIAHVQFPMQRVLAD